MGTISSIDRAMVLRYSTRNLCTALGLPMLGEDPNASLDTPVATDDNDAQDFTETVSTTKAFMKKPNSGPMKY